MMAQRPGVEMPQGQPLPMKGTMLPVKGSSFPPGDNAPAGGASGTGEVPLKGILYP